MVSLSPRAATMSDSVATLKLAPSVPPGYPLPLSTPYAISLSLPTWSDHADFWLLGEKVFASYANSYPRLFPHRSVREVRIRDFQMTPLLISITDVFSLRLSLRRCMVQMKKSVFHSLLDVLPKSVAHTCRLALSTPIF